MILIRLHSRKAKIKRVKKIVIFRGSGSRRNGGKNKWGTKDFGR